MTQPSPALLEELKMIPGVFVRSGRVRCTPDVAFVLQEKGIPFDLVKRPSRVVEGTTLMAQRLKSFQVENALALREDRIRALFWSCGVGKTATALTAAVPPALIVTRAMARDVFPRDGAWTWPGAPFTIVLGMGKGGKALDYAVRRTNKRLERLRAQGATVEAVGSLAEARDAAFTVVGWDTLDAHWEEIAAWRRWETFIVDESHMASGRLSQRGKAARMLATRAKRSWLLTATPVPNRLVDLPGQLAIIDRDAWGSSYKFAMRYCDARMNNYGGLDTSGSSYVEELKQRIGYWASILTRRDVGSTLPAGTREIFRIDAGKKLVRIPKDRMRRGIEAAIAWSAEIKLPDVCKRAVECLVGLEKVVLVSNRKAWIPRAERLVLKGLHRAPRHVRENVWLRSTSGDDPVPARRKLVDEYMDRKDLACLIATTDSIGQSIDMQQTDRVIIAAVPVTPLGAIQFEGRFIRHGGRPCAFEYWLADGTIDEAIEESFLGKMDTVIDVAVATTEVGLQSAARESEDEIVAGLSAWLEKRAAAIDGAVLDLED